jgi:hypothetical protein
VKPVLSHTLRLAALLAIALLSLQFFFVARIALMNVLDPQSRGACWWNNSASRGASAGSTTRASRRT